MRVCLINEEGGSNLEKHETSLLLLPAAAAAPELPPLAPAGRSPPQPELGSRRPIPPHIGIEVSRKKKHDARDPLGSKVRGGWADLSLVGLVGYLLGWRGGRS